MFAVVAILPEVMVTLLLTVILELRSSPALTLVRLLKVVTPLMLCCPALVKVTPPPWGLNVPPLFQVPFRVSAKLLALTSSVVPAPILRLPLTVIAPPRVFVPPPLVRR